MSEMEHKSGENGHENQSFSIQEDEGNYDELLSENKKMRDEFNSQRAKMKELFLQKEGELMRKTEENAKLIENVQKLQNELDDVKTQLLVDSMTRESNFEVEKRKAEEEIASLQTLVHETVEESSSTRTLYDNELQKLQSYIQYLQNEIQTLKKEKEQSPHHTSQEHSLAPSVVLNALTKGIVKKLGADTFSSQDSDDSSKKPIEDTELLKSLLEPLEDQITALKEKLRATDEQLQRCKECGHNSTNQIALSDQSSQHISLQSTTATNTSFETQRPESHCDMCSNYEAQLVKEQQRTSELEGKVGAAEKAAERHKDDLLKEIGFRKEMEEKWNEKKEEHKTQVGELTRATECTEQDLRELRQFFDQSCKEMMDKLGSLTREREHIYQELDKLQKENDNLVGKYTIHSNELQSEVINLPNTVEELHELILKNHQELIIAKIGKESAEEQVNTLQSEIMFLKDQVKSVQHEKRKMESSIINLKKNVDQLLNDKQTYTTNQEKLINAGKASQAKIVELEAKIVELNNTVQQCKNENIELRTRVCSLQQELDTSETVQKDFVMLSQSLQRELEKIRESDTQVRWQHDEDVEECPSCRNTFTQSRRKEHCRHCGQIFCRQCLTRTVSSGPRARPSRVCHVCHTLLVKSSAPYFSEAPPMS